MAIESGTAIHPNIRLKRELASGPLSSVWIADHLTLCTEVAVKLVSNETLRSDEGRLRFSREAALAARIKSPHVVQVFDHGSTPDGIPYIVMELLEGEDLRSRLLRLGKLDCAQTVEIVRQVSKALSRAHAEGMVHRDIKPENVFLQQSDGELFVKVLDFGIAKKPGDESFVRTSTGSFIGTPQYMSPEQVMSSRSVDLRADLWALAIVAYECLVGVPPFQAPSVGGIYVALDYGRFAPPSARVPTLTRALDAWFARALNRDPAQRFGSAIELAESFAAAARGSNRPPEPLSELPATAAAGPLALRAITKLDAPARDAPLAAKRALDPSFSTQALGPDRVQDQAAQTQASMQVPTGTVRIDSGAAPPISVPPVRAHTRLALIALVGFGLLGAAIAIAGALLIAKLRASAVAAEPPSAVAPTSSIDALHTSRVPEVAPILQPSPEPSSSSSAARPGVTARARAPSAPPTASSAALPPGSAASAPPRARDWGF